LRNVILEVIENQINANDPAETAITLKRLLDEGTNLPEIFDVTLYYEDKYLI
jgi:hypothetical protein